MKVFFYSSKFVKFGNEKQNIKSKSSFLPKGDNQGEFLPLLLVFGISDSESQTSFGQSCLNNYLIILLFFIIKYSGVINMAAYMPKYLVNADNVINELSNYMLVDGYDFVLDLMNSRSASFIDARTGKDYLDFFTCFASMPIGMNHPKIQNPEFIDYIGKVALNKPSNSDIYTSEMATFVKTFFKIADISKFKYSFFISGGALAVENALKAAFDWKVRKNKAKGVKGEKGHQIIHFKQAFHGRSGYTMSLTNTDPNKIELFPKFDWPRISNPFIIFPENEGNIATVIEHEDKAVTEIKAAFKKHKDDIAAIILEPIQGEGGDNHFRPEFISKLRDLTIENEALLIFDEVQTGVGITGKWWAHQHTDVVPDIMCFGKKMQVCGILVTDRIDEVDDNVFHKSSRINSTWGGNLVDMVRSTRYLEIIEEEKLVENAANSGEHLKQRLIELSNEFPEEVLHVRGKGLFCAFNMKDNKSRNNLIKKCFESGVLILTSGKNSVRFRPPLNISKKQIDVGLEIIKNCLK